MAAMEGAFSESWYRIRDRRIALRPHVRLNRQMFRGERWHVLHDPFGHQFFRLRPPVYQFISRLSRERTLQEIWEECLRLFPDDAPGQQEVVHLLAQLFHANLIQSDHPADSAKLFERMRKRKRKEVGKRLLTIMFARFHLIDPDRFLVRFLPLVRPLLSPWAMVLWVVVVLLGLKAVVDNAGSFFAQAQGVLAPGNLILLYLSLVVLKTLHEFGHAFVCRHFGGQVHDMGIMLLVFTPLPYMNATSAWAFRERWKRVMVGASGMIVEVFIAAIAAMVWAATGPGTIQALAYNMVLVASVSTIIFNANPLLRFDGYYILSDLLDVPNLHSRASRMWRHFVERRWFGMREEAAVENPSNSTAGAWGLATFGAMAFVYRIFVFAGILLFVGNRFLLLGILMVVFCIVAWMIAPVVKLIRHLATSPSLYRVRLRATSVVVGLVAGILLLLGVLPFRVSVAVPGMVRARENSLVNSETRARVAEILTPPGTWVQTGDALVRMEATELDLAIAAAEAQIKEINARLRESRELLPANLQPLNSARIDLEARLADLLFRRENLILRARHDGWWSAPRLESGDGLWFERGEALGTIIDPSPSIFHAVVPQTEASRLFGESVREAQVRLRGDAEVSLPVHRMDVVPGERFILPGPALGWMGGGEVAVDPADPEGLRTVEPFFEVRIWLPEDSGVLLAHGRTGRARFTFPPEPLLTQWLRKLRQLVQKRYQI